MGVVNLSKNQVVNLSKSAEGLKQVVVGLGWDEAKASSEKKGLFGRIFGSSSSGSTQSIDCDAFAVMLESNDRLASNDDVIFYGNLHAKGGSVSHTGDNLTGEGDGDDEQIIINLPAVNNRITKIIIGVCIFRGTEKGQDFSKIENAFVRIVNSNNNQEMCRYNLSGKEYGGYTTMKFGELYRESDGSWAFRACGEPDRADSIRSYTGNFR